MSNCLHMSPPATDIEVDADLAAKVYGYAWHDLGFDQRQACRVYFFGSVERVAADLPRLERLPVMHMRNGHPFNAQGERCAVVHANDLPRPTQNLGEAWNLVRFVNRQHRLGVMVSELPADVFTGEKFAVVISWHRPTPDGKINNDGPLVCYCGESTIERAFTRGVLVLLATLEQEAAQAAAAAAQPAQAPPPPQLPPPA